MSWKFNIFTGTFDIAGPSTGTLGGLFLKLDQTTPQTVVNGSPEFGSGLTIAKDQFIYLDGA